MLAAIWTVAAALCVPSVAGAQRPVFVDGWSSETHPAERFAADSASCVTVGAEIATVTGKPAAPEFARCLRKKRRLAPPPKRWEEASDAELDAYSRMAKPVVK